MAKAASAARALKNCMVETFMYGFGMGEVWVGIHALLACKSIIIRNERDTICESGAKRSWLF